MQNDIFTAFRKYVESRLTLYLEDLGIHARLFFNQRANWISARFRWKDKELSLSFTVQPAEQREGIKVLLKSRFGEYNLRALVAESNGDFPMYGYDVYEMNSQIDRILKDIKLYFEKHLLV